MKTDDKNSSVWPHIMDATSPSNEFKPRWNSVEDIPKDLVWLVKEINKWPKYAGCIFCDDGDYQVMITACSFYVSGGAYVEEEFNEAKRVIEESKEPSACLQCGALADEQLAAEKEAEEREKRINNLANNVALATALMTDEAREAIDCLIKFGWLTDTKGDA